MRTEAKKSFNHGFLLTEAEVRRLASDIHDRLVKDTSDSIVPSFELQHRNGTTTNPSSLDQVLCESNSGPTLITKFRMSFSLNDTSPPSRLVSIEFANAWHHLSKAIKYTVSSDDRDWAFVVTSRIDDRIAAIKHRHFDYVSLIFSFVFIPIILAVILWAFYLGLPIGDEEIKRLYRDLQLTEMAQLREDWSSGRLTDPVDTYLRGLEILIRPTIPDNLAQDYESLRSIVWLAISLLVVGCIAALGMEVFFPRYNFYWGDYVGKYKKRVFWGQILYGAVVLAFIVGVAGSYIANMIPRP
jgi:hypothetical protein